MPPGVNEVMLASDPEPETHMIESKVTGIENAARKIPVTISLQHQARNEGRNTHSRYFFGCDRITPPCFACSHSFFTCRQKILARTASPTATPAMMATNRSGCAVRLLKLRLNEFGTERNM